MEQLSMFKESGQSPGLPEELLEYHPGLFSESESVILLNHFIANSPLEAKDRQDV